MTAAVAPMLAPSRFMRRSVRVRPEAGMLVATLSAQVPGLEAALARQPELLAPVKLAASARGDTELRAELLRARGIDTEALARRALSQATAWLAGDAADAMPDANELHAEAIAAGLSELPKAWAWEPQGEDGFHVHATAFGTSVRILVEGRASTTVASVRSAVPAATADTREALVRFALETNARVRLARIGVAASDEGSARVTWDAVASPGVALERALPAAVEAVVGAHATTRRALRALSHAAVARAYLDARCGAAAQGCAAAGARARFLPA